MQLGYAFSWQRLIKLFVLRIWQRLLGRCILSKAI